MSIQSLPRAVYEAALKKKPPKRMRQLSPEVYAKAYNKLRFYEACQKRKADPVFRIVRGPIAPECPASALRRCPQAELLLDADSAARL